MNTHYDNLKVARTAPAEVIRAAYKALSQRYHPDKNPSPDASRIMRILNDAYSILGDPDRRAAYDLEIERDEERQGAAKEPENESSAATSQSESEDNSERSRDRPSAGPTSQSTESQPAFVPKFGSPWARFLARTFDVWWETLAIGLGIGYYLGRHSIEFVQWSTGPGSDTIVRLGCLPIAMVVDAGIYALIGNTPGKALLGLKVTGLDGRRLTYAEYSRRNLSVWASGLALGLPIFNLFTMSRQSKELNKGLQTTYDTATGFRVRAKSIGLPRKTLFAVAFVALITAGLGLKGTSDQRVRDIQANIAAKPYSWSNPLTHNVANVDGIWRPAVTLTQDNQPVYTFTEATGHAVVVLAREVEPDISMREYVPAYLASTSSFMSLSGPSPNMEPSALESWTADGYVKSKADVRAHVELRHIGSAFWRMVTIQSLPYGYSDVATQSLRDQLWGTVAGT